MHQEQQRSIAHPRQAGTEAAGVAQVAVLGVHRFLHHLPLHAEGRVGQAVVEALGGQLVVAERVAQLQVAHVVALDQLVGHADGVGLGVQLLRVGHDARVGVPLGHLLDSRRQEAASAGSAVVHRAHHAIAVQRLMVGGKDQGGDQPHHVARGEVFAGVVIGGLGELADQVLKHQAHVVVGQAAGVQVNAAELLRHQVQQVGTFQLDQPVVEAEVLEDLPGVGREAGQVLLQVGPGGGGSQRVQAVLAGVVERRAGHGGQHQVDVYTGAGQRGVPVAHGIAGGLQHTFQAPQHGEGQDDAAVQRRPKGAAQGVGDVPDEVAEGLLIHGH